MGWFFPFLKRGEKPKKMITFVGGLEMGHVAFECILYNVRAREGDVSLI